MENSEMLPLAEITHTPQKSHGLIDGGDFIDPDTVDAWIDDRSVEDSGESEYNPEYISGEDFKEMESELAELRDFSDRLLKLRGLSLPQSSCHHLPPRAERSTMSPKPPVGSPPAAPASRKAS